MSGMNIAFGSLRAFDAAARHGSFRLAAEELNLSPSAVSHAISKLEKSLGALLFDRNGRSLSLTQNGQTLHKHVEEAFGHIRVGVMAVSARQAQLLRLHTAPSFAAQWLTPRLADFLEKHPGMEVRIAASTDYSRFAADEFDADIVYGKPDNDSLVVHSLGREVVKPMCSPKMAEKIKTPEDLYGLTLIRSSLKAVTWEDWFKANRLKAPEAVGMRFDRSFMSVQAAADGLGVCLDSTRLAERELASGRLVAPLDGQCDNLIYAPHYLVYPKRNAQRPIVAAFARWLIGELAKDPAADLEPLVRGEVDSSVG
ncbi:LysR substrate-binding domain-containing protein [Brevundimonas sp.]|uniref:LysR substrate-binding domain-containing protein n=1 Tax=Brevundimonas sp. TaxID=1871086 RepID=UPI003F6F045C